MAKLFKQKDLLGFIERFGRVLSNKGKLTAYQCPHCEKWIPTHQPTKALCGSKGYWDSCTTCLLCGDVSFVKVYPSGRTSAKKM